MKAQIEFTSPRDCAKLSRRLESLQKCQAEWREFRTGLANEDRSASCGMTVLLPKIEVIERMLADAINYGLDLIAVLNGPATNIRQTRWANLVWRSRISRFVAALMDFQCTELMWELRATQWAQDLIFTRAGKLVPLADTDDNWHDWMSEPRRNMFNSVQYWLLFDVRKLHRWCRVRAIELRRYEREDAETAHALAALLEKHNAQTERHVFKAAFAWLLDLQNADLLDDDAMSRVPRQTHELIERYARNSQELALRVGAWKLEHRKARS